VRRRLIKSIQFQCCQKKRFAPATSALPLNHQSAIEWNFTQLNRAPPAAKRQNFPVIKNLVWISLKIICLAKDKFFVFEFSIFPSLLAAASHSHCDPKKFMIN